MRIETLASLYRAAGHELPAVHERSESISSVIPGSASYEALAFGAPTYTGRSVNPNSALTYTAVWLCEKLLSESVASTPLYTYRNLSPDGLDRVLAIDDYRYRMLREEPNPEMSSMQWRQFGMLSLLGWGNWYNYLDWDGRGRLKAIWPLRPDWMIVLRNPRTRQLEYRYNPMYPFSAPVEPGVYQPFQICHIPGIGWDGLVGYSPITMCRNAVALGQAYEESGGRFVSGGGTQKVALVTQQGARIGDAAEVRREWRNANAGLDKAGEVALLQGLDVKTFGIAPKDAQFLEGRSFQLAEIARIFNVPLGMLHDMMSKPETYASAEQADLRFVKYSIRPWCKLIEEKLNLSVLASQDALTCKHDLSDLLRGDLQSQMDAYAAAVSGGIMLPDEARARIDLTPYGGPAKKLYMQAQMVQLGSSTPQEPASEYQNDPPQEQQNG